MSHAVCGPLPLLFFAIVHETIIIRSIFFFTALRRYFTARRLRLLFTSSLKLYRQKNARFQLHRDTSAPWFPSRLLFEFFKKELFYVYRLFLLSRLTEFYFLQFPGNKQWDDRR